jgi:hypothetical protein
MKALVEAGRKALVTKRHPDRGGSVELVARYNAAAGNTLEVIRAMKEGGLV